MGLNIFQKSTVLKIYLVKLFLEVVYSAILTCMTFQKEPHLLKENKKEKKKRKKRKNMHVITRQ